MRGIEGFNYKFSARCGCSSDTERWDFSCLCRLCAGLVGHIAHIRTGRCDLSNVAHGSDTGLADGTNDSFPVSRSEDYRAVTSTLKTPRKRSGAATVEMALVGIPVVFMLVSVFEISRGMWIYHTLAYGVKEGVRFAMVRGKNCVHNPPSVLNNCATCIGGACASLSGVKSVSQVIQDAAVGVDLNNTSLTFYAPAGTNSVMCNLSGSNPCSAKTTTWPPTSADDIGLTIQIDIKTQFNSALAMFWPGSKPVAFTTVFLGASSTELIQF
jgi:hypothetical protein